MIAYLQGTIKKKLPKAIIIDTGNVGYMVQVPAHLAEKSVEKEEIELFIYTKVREDDISLFGFETLDELDFFKVLIGISGIGAKTATEIMNQNLAKVKAAIVNKDVQFLSKIPGIGKKSAERIIVELKNKVDLDGLTLSETTNSNIVDDDAMVALASLGYQRYEINRVLRKMPDGIKEVEEIVTYFLQNV